MMLSNRLSLEDVINEKQNYTFAYICLFLKKNFINRLKTFMQDEIRITI